MENKRDFLNIMNRSAIIYEREFSQAFVDAYWLLLKQYDLNEFTKAMNIICRTSKFWPRPAEIIETIKKITGEGGSIEAVAEQQWRVVVDAIRQNGINRQPKFDDPITNYLIQRQFSWPYLCEMQQKNENWEQKRFCQAYEFAAECGHHTLFIEAENQYKRLLAK